MDAHTQLVVIVVVKAFAELAGLFLLGQGLLYLLAGRKRDANNFYQLFRVLTRPVLGFTRMITPRVVADQHIPYAAMMLVVWVWLGCVYAKASLCAEAGLDCFPRGEAAAALGYLVG